MISVLVGDGSSDGRDHGRKTILVLRIHEQVLGLAQVLCQRVLLEFTDFVSTTQMEFDWSKYLQFI